MEHFQIRIERPSDWLVLSVLVEPAEEAGWLHAEIGDALLSGRSPYQLRLWLPELVDYVDVELEIRVDMTSWGKRMANGDEVVAYHIVARADR